MMDKKYKTLREWKIQGGHSLTFLSRKIGICLSHLSLIYAGKRIPSPKLAERIERETGVPRLNLLYPNTEKKEKE